MGEKVGEEGGREEEGGGRETERGFTLLFVFGRGFGFEEERVLEEGGGVLGRILGEVR